MQYTSNTFSSQKFSPKKILRSWAILATKLGHFSNKAGPFKQQIRAFSATKLGHFSDKAGPF